MRVFQFRIRGLTPETAGQSDRTSRWRGAGVALVVLGSLLYLGTHLRPAISLTSLPAFAEQPIASSSPIVTLLLSNTGAAPLTIENATLEGDAQNDFVLERSGCLLHDLAPGQSCLVGVGFRPREEGVRAARLVITGNDPESPHVLPLSGTGFRPYSPKPDPSIVPAGYQFGGLEANNEAPLPIQINNEGDGTLHVDSIQLSEAAGDAWSLNPADCTNHDIEPNGACAFTLTFKPVASGTYATQIVVNHNAGSPLVAQFTGQGLPAHGYCCVGEKFGKLDADTCQRMGGFFSTNLDEVRSQCRVRDTQPPPIPTGLTPGTPELKSPGHIWPCTNVRLAWQPVSDPSSPVTYHVTLQQPDVRLLRASADPWGTRLNNNDVHEPLIDITAWVSPATAKTALAKPDRRAAYIYAPQAGRPTLYRWNVSARDSAGNESAPSVWFYFSCQQPPVG